MRKSGKRKPGRYDLRFCIQLALAVCISFCTKITVRFKLNLKTDGLACKIIFKIGGQFERLHSTRKQCRRIYICLFCVAKYLLYKHHLRCKILVGNTQTRELHPLDAGRLS